MEYIAGAVLATLVVLAIVFFIRKKSPPPVTVHEAQVISVIAQPADVSDAGAAIAIGDDPAHPMVTIAPTTAIADYEGGRRLDVHSRTISRLGALMQAVPSLAVAHEAAGKKLMEVVINGDLVRAADGNGMRAFSMGTKGIQEHARLFDVDKLQTMINAGAMWQIASVVVAQKHLADISAKLDEIKAGVTAISTFLDTQRKSRILGTYDYLCQAHRAIDGGELSESVRAQLEDCERDLLELQLHLHEDYRRVFSKKVEDKEMIGTEELTANISRKIADLDKLRKDILLCTRTRILAWHVLSLYPGEPHLKQARRESIEKAIATFEALGRQGQLSIAGEISNVKSRFNREETLQQRRTKLTVESGDVARTIGSNAQLNKISIQTSVQRMLTLDRPSTIVFEFSGRELVGAREIGVRAA